MSKLIFATGNNLKFKIADSASAKHRISLIQQPLKIDEIQSEDPEMVAKDKAQKAFDLLQKPLFISDDSWAFTGLNGFPGTYMHSINQWFTPEDFLHLTLPLKDRRVVLTQMIVYQSQTLQKIFTAQTEGLLLKEVRGESAYPNHTIIAMPGDHGLSLAEVYQQDQPIEEDRQVGQIWHDFFDWFGKQ